MILAGNESKQRGPLHIYLENQDGVRFPSETDVSRFMIVTDIGAYIRCNFTS